LGSGLRDTSDATSRYLQEVLHAAIARGRCHTHTCRYHSRRHGRFRKTAGARSCCRGCWRRVTVSACWWRWRARHRAEGRKGKNAKVMKRSVYECNGGCCRITVLGAAAAAAAEAAAATATRACAALASHGCVCVFEALRGLSSGAGSGLKRAKREAIRLSDQSAVIAHTRSMTKAQTRLETG